MIAFVGQSAATSPPSGVAVERQAAGMAATGAGAGAVDRLVSPGDAFTAIHRDLLEEYSPEGPVEEEWVRQLAGAIVRLRQYEGARHAAIQTGHATFSSLMEGFSDAVLGPAARPAAPAGDTMPEGIVAETALVNVMSSRPVREFEKRITEQQKQVRTLTALLQKEQSRREVRRIPQLADSLGFAVRHVADDVTYVGADNAPAVEASAPWCSSRGAPSPGAQRVEGTPTGVAGAMGGVAISTAALSTAGQSPSLAPSSMPSCLPPQGPGRAQREVGDRASGWVAVATEADCEELFRAWRRRGGLACPHCAALEAPLEITGRRVLQCRRCGRQYGLRTGTLLAASNIPFLAVVQTARMLVNNPAVPCESLRRVTGLGRQAQRRLRDLFHAALGDADRRKDLLAACGWRLV